MFQGCGKPQLGRRRRAISPRFIETEAKYFDDLDNFSFDEDGNGGGDVVVYQPDNTDGRIKRSAADSTNRELKFEPLKFSSRDDVHSDLDSNGKGRKNKNKKKQSSSGTKKDGEENDDNKEPSTYTSSIFPITSNIFTSLFLVMDKLVKDIRLKVKESKKFWTNLPFQVCNGEDYAMAVGIEGSCWNGVNTDK